MSKLGLSNISNVLQVLAEFMAEIRGNKVSFDPIKLVLMAGATSQGRPCGAGGLRRHAKRGPIVYKFFFYL